MRRTAPAAPPVTPSVRALIFVCALAFKVFDLVTLLLVAGGTTEESFWQAGCLKIASQKAGRRTCVPENAIIVTGSKGGVGTSTVALNLAVQLAMQTRKRVALVDLARPFGQISLMLDLDPRFTVLDALERIERLDGRLLASMTLHHKTGVDILAGPLHAPMRVEQRQSVTIQAISRLIDIACGAYDFVLADIGVVNTPEWGAVLREARTILLVAEASVLALGMIEQHMAAAAPAGVDCERIHIIINRWRQNDDDALAAFEKKYRRTIRKRLPNDYRQLTEAVQLGMPLTGSANNPLIARYRDLALWLSNGKALEEADPSAAKALS
jgi:pilus assembly protein CpaE